MLVHRPSPSVSSWGAATEQGFIIDVVKAAEI